MEVSMTLESWPWHCWKISAAPEHAFSCEEPQPLDLHELCGQDDGCHLSSAGGKATSRETQGKST